MAHTNLARFHNIGTLCGSTHSRAAPQSFQQLPQLVGAMRINITSALPCPRAFRINVATSETESGSQDAIELIPRALRYGIAAQQGPRDAMEDVTLVIERGRCDFLFATVFDGHAGKAAANYLKEHLYDVLSEMLDEQSLGLECSLTEREEGICCPLELHTVLTSCYKKADESLLRFLATLEGDEGMAGCTATTALVRSDRVIVANVGDSRAVLCRSGNAVDLSTEHRVYGRGPSVASETLRVQEAGGWIDDGRVCGILAVSRAFGDPDFKGAGLPKLLSRGVEDELWTQDFASAAKFVSDPVTADPDVLEMSVSQGKDEFLVLASDGLWDVMGSQEVITIARNDFIRGKDPEAVAERLTSLALRRRTGDNVAVVVVDLLGAEGWAAMEKPKAKLFGLF